MTPDLTGKEDPAMELAVDASQIGQAETEYNSTANGSTPNGKNQRIGFAVCDRRKDKTQEEIKRNNASTEGLTDPKRRRQMRRGRREIGGVAKIWKAESEDPQHHHQQPQPQQ